MAVSILGLIFCLVSTPDAMAGQKNTTPPPIDRRILVTAVDVSAQQITITYQRDKSKHVYTVDAMTAVKAHGLDGSSIKNIKVGDQVCAYIERDDVALSSLDVEVAEPGPNIPVAKKK